MAAGATLDATQLNAIFPQNNNNANVTGGLTLLGTINLGAANGSTFGQLFFQGTQTLGGTGTVVFGSSASNALYERINGTGILTIGSGITVQGGSGTISGYGTFSANESVINNGTISIPAGQALVLGGVNWSNGGTITANGATITLGGSFATPALGNFAASGGAVRLTGTLNNVGSTLTLQPATGGNWSLSGGTINGGIIDSSGGQPLRLTNAGGRLAGVTVAAGATLDATQLNAIFPQNNNNANVTGGLTLLGTINLGAANGSTFGQLFFQGTQTLGGTGTVVFGSSASNALYERINGTGILTIGSGITVQGGSGTISGYGTFSANESVINQGKITAAGAGRNINLSPTSTGTFANTGMLEASNGGSLTTASLESSHAGIIYVGVGSVVQIGALSQAPSAQIDFDVRGLGNSNFGRLNIAGAAILAGTLNVNFTDGYVPTIGDSFQLLTFASHSGAFSTVNAVGLDVGTALNVAYNATNITATVVSALTAAAMPAVSNTSRLTQASLDRTVDLAIALWVTSGLNSFAIERLRSISFNIADLGSSYLGHAAGNTVWIDDNAANWGWFVDDDSFDEEFEIAGEDGVLRTADESPAAWHIDLLTVVMHELGHELGLEHSDDFGDLMFSSLEAGTRKRIFEKDLDAAFAGWR